ncbi:MAG: hypothetical protein J6Y80_06500 [Victivallales bacterium]|nr:hypothetical protein [Victivallales bacterium]
MKENLEKFWRGILCAICVAALFTATPAWADDDDDDDDESVSVGDVIQELTWDERKKDIEAFWDNKIAEYRSQQENLFKGQMVVEFIKLQVRRRVNNAQMGDFRILRLPGLEIDWTGFDQRCTKDKDTIVDDVRAAALQHALEKIRPEERKQAIRDNADERFRMVEIGERVTLMLRQGRGASALIENKPLRGVNDERVQLGDRFIIREDLDEEDQAKFYPDVNARLKEAYVVNQTGKIDVEIESMIAQECYDNTASAFLAENYVPDIMKPTASLRTAKPEFWMPKYDFVERVRKKVIDARFELFKATEMPQVMEGAGYFLMPTKDGKVNPRYGSNKEWVDLTEKAAREAAAAAPAQNENDMYGPMGPGAPMPPPSGY